MGRRYASVRVRVGFILQDGESIDDVLPHIVTMPVMKDRQSSVMWASGDEEIRPLTDNAEDAIHVG